MAPCLLVQVDKEAKIDLLAMLAFLLVKISWNVSSPRPRRIPIPLPPYCATTTHCLLSRAVTMVAVVVSLE